MIVIEVCMSCSVALDVEEQKYRVSIHQRPWCVGYGVGCLRRPS
jgi:hypothetical protein